MRSFIKLIPLLVEQFYDEWAKVCAVLGEHPKEPRPRDMIRKKKLLAEGLFESKADLKDKTSYSVGDHCTWTVPHFAKES